MQTSIWFRSFLYDWYNVKSWLAETPLLRVFWLVYRVGELLVQELLGIRISTTRSGTMQPCRYLTTGEKGGLQYRNYLVGSSSRSCESQRREMEIQKALPMLYVERHGHLSPTRQPRQARGQGDCGPRLEPHPCTLQRGTFRPRILLR